MVGMEQTEAMTMKKVPPPPPPSTTTTSVGAQQQDQQEQPQPQQQHRIYAIRHGQSEWNVLHEMYPREEDRFHPRMKKIDSDMTDLGVQQCRDAGRRFSELLSSVGVVSPDYVLVSPLKRALYSASYILEAFVPSTLSFCVDENDRNITTTSGPSPSLRGLPASIKVEICKDCTEVLIDSCDIGTPVTTLSREFPQWDFSTLAVDDLNHKDTTITTNDRHDYWWYGGHDPETTWSLMQSEEGFRESDSHVVERIQSFKQYMKELLLLRKHSSTTTTTTTTIVVVCHSETIWYLTSTVNPDTGERLGGTMTKNAEILDITNHIITIE
jgi:broad specificity phosphatase PhoE